MPEKLKDTLIPADQVVKLAEAIQSVYLEFESGEFTRLVLDSDWADRELKQKMRHVTVCLKQKLPANYPESIRILEQITPQFRGFIALSFSDFAECYGMDDWDISMNALARFTGSCSSEFAVRPFLDKDPQRAIRYFTGGLKMRVSTFAGCQVKAAGRDCRGEWDYESFEKDPAPIIPILEKLKNDPEDYVRRSVANNLNDISKDHPLLVLDLFEKWKGQSKDVDRIIKHASRTMLKAGNKRALMLFGFANPDQLQVSNLSADQPILKIGEHLSFSFTLVNHSGKTQTIRLEYRIHYVKSNGKTSPKIFQISEGKFPPGEHAISKKQAFTDFTTRTHFPGEHRIEIVVNGDAKAEIKFSLER